MTKKELMNLKYGDIVYDKRTNQSWYFVDRLMLEDWDTPEGRRYYSDSPVIYARIFPTFKSKDYKSQKLKMKTMLNSYALSVKSN